MTVTTFVALLVFAPPAGGVVNGRDAGLGRLPVDRLMREVTVRLIEVTAKGETPICSGVQVSQRTVLSAGHCLGPDSMTAMNRGTLYVESFDPLAPDRRRRSRVTGLEGGNNSKVDFAVLRTADDLPAKQSLPIAYFGCDETSRFLMAGFGMTESGSASRTLKVAGGAHPTAEEKEGVRKITSPESRRVTVGARGAARVCNGDSGGPVFCFRHGKLAIAGVTNTISGNFGPQTPKPDLPTQEFCRDWTYATDFTPIKDGMKQIEAWRANEPPAKSADRATGTATAAR